MKFVVITLFPEMFDGVISSSILGRATEKGLVDFEFVNLRDFGLGVRRQVDDTPYGGGAGMVLRVDVMAAAIDAAKARLGVISTETEKSSKEIEIRSLDVARDDSSSKNYKVILLTPQGERLIQPKLREMADFDGDYIFICGHYEGFDERIRDLVDEEISIGDFVLTGGELGAMVLIDGISRLLPGVLGSEASHQDESHSSEGRIEYPHYTRPDEWNGKSVPDVLKSGNHGEIEKWRKKQSENKSKK